MKTPEQVALNRAYAKAVRALADLEKEFTLKVAHLTGTEKARYAAEANKRYFALKAQIEEFKTKAATMKTNPPLQAIDMAAVSRVIPPLSRWNTYASGTGAPRGERYAHSYEFIFDGGRYYIDPVATTSGRFAYWQPKFANDRGKLTGGLWTMLQVAHTKTGALAKIRGHYGAHFMTKTNPVPRGRGRVLRTRTVGRGAKRLTCEVMSKAGPRGGHTVCHPAKRNPVGPAQAAAIRLLNDKPLQWHRAGPKFRISIPVAESLADAGLAEVRNRFGIVSVRFRGPSADDPRRNPVNRWGTKLRKGQRVRMHHSRGGTEEGVIVAFETKGEFARAYGARVKLDSGFTGSLDDVIEILPAVPKTNPGRLRSRGGLRTYWWKEQGVGTWKKDVAASAHTIAVRHAPSGATVMPGDLRGPGEWRFEFSGGDRGGFIWVSDHARVKANPARAMHPRRVVSAIVVQHRPGDHRTYVAKGRHALRLVASIEEADSFPLSRARRIARALSKRYGGGFNAEQV